MYNLGDVIGLMLGAVCMGFCIGGLVTLHFEEKELDKARNEWFNIGELTGRINERCEIITERHNKPEKKTSNDKKAKKLRAK